MADAKVPTVLRRTPRIQGRNLKDLRLNAFDFDAGQAPIIGDYGRRGSAANVEFVLPPQLSPEALITLSDGEVQRLISEANDTYDILEQEANGQQVSIEEQFRGTALENIDRGSAAGGEQLRQLGYTRVDVDNGEEGGGSMYLNPAQHAQYQQNQQVNERRNAANRLLSEVRQAAERDLYERQQSQLRAQNQLYAGIVEAGYEFAPGALNDANVRAAIWENRNNPKYFESAAARNFSRNTADPNSRHASEQRAFTVADLAKMGVGLPGYGQQGQQTTIVRPGGVTEQPGDNVAPRYATPDETMAPEDVVTRMPMLRPDPARVGAPPRSTLMRAPRIRSAPTIVGRSGVM